jgi:hypothetical protein
MRDPTARHLSLLCIYYSKQIHPIPFLFIFLRNVAFVIPQWRSRADPGFLHAQDEGPFETIRHAEPTQLRRVLAH